jgi:hypothetical protein
VAVLLLMAAGCRSRDYVTLSPSEFLARYEIACALAESPVPRADPRRAGRDGDWCQFDYWSGNPVSIGMAYVCTYRTPAAWVADGFPDGFEPGHHTWPMRDRLPPAEREKLARIRDLAAVVPDVAIPELVGYLMDDAPLVGGYSAHVLGEFGPDACGALENALSEAGHRATPALIAAVGYCGCTDLAPRLLEMVMAEELPGAGTGEAIQVLLWTGRAGDVILIAREHQSPTVRMFARALSEESTASDTVFRRNWSPAPANWLAPPAS